MGLTTNFSQYSDVKRHSARHSNLYLYIVRHSLLFIMTKTINIEEKLYNELQKEAEQHSETLRSHIEHTLWNVKRKQDLVKRIFDGLEVERDEHTRIILKNLAERKFYDVDVLKNGSELRCKQCNSQNCKHTAFVWTQFEDLDIHLSK